MRKKSFFLSFFLLAIPCVVLMQLNGIALASRGGERERLPHFARAVAEAERRLAVIEPAGGGAMPIPPATGVFVNTDGGVVTSLAAIAGAEKVYVKELHKERHPAQIIAVDQALGIAFLKTPVELEVFPAPPAQPAEPGEWVIVTYTSGTDGLFPGGKEKSERTYELELFPAIVSSNSAEIKLSGRMYKRLMKLNVVTPGGSAMAPVFNSRGQLEGLVVAVRQCTATADCTYVLKTDKLQDVVAKLREGESGRLPWLGIALQSATEERDGVKIAAVMRDGPAHRAGLKAGDIIRSVDGREAPVPSVLESIINESAPGETIALETERDGEVKKMNVQLGHRPLMISTPAPDPARPLRKAK